MPAKQTVNAKKAWFFIYLARAWKLKEADSQPEGDQMRKRL
jgi:hypothetical protein